MLPLRLLLTLLLVVIVGYTGVVITRHGLDFLPIFFGDITRLGWPGQFNMDFTGMLLLSALWVSWRHRFGVAGLVLGLIALFGGTPFLCLYLLIQSTRSGGDIRTLLLGSRLHEGRP